MRIGPIGRNVVVVAAGAALLAGCGSKDDSGTASPAASGVPAATTSAAAADNGVAALQPVAIVDKAKAALKSAKSFHMKGTITDQGQKTALDFKIAGGEVFGTMSVGTAKIQVLKAGGGQYMKPDAAFWKLTAGKQADAVVKKVGDKWVSVPASNKEFGSLFTAADVDTLLQADGQVAKGQPKVIAGTPAIGLVDKGTEGGTLYVATVGQPYPLELDGPTAADGGIAFSEFGAAFDEIKAPAAADVLDLSKLG